MSPLTKSYNLCTGETSAITDELLNSSLTHAEMARRLGVKSSTLSDAKKKRIFSEWSKRALLNQKNQN